jgi:RecJ-like exonuclease
MLKTCPVCKGKGKLHTPLPLPAVVRCLSCHGTGQIEAATPPKKVPFLFKVFVWISALFKDQSRKQRQKGDGES